MCQHLKIFWSIIQAVAVSVVDMFAGFQRAPKHLSGDNSVLIGPAPRSANADLTVPKIFSSICQASRTKRPLFQISFSDRDHHLLFGFSSPRVSWGSPTPRSNSVFHRLSLLLDRLGRASMAWSKTGFISLRFHSKHCMPFGSLCQ